LTRENGYRCNNRNEINFKELIKPMKPLIVLLVSFLISLLTLRLLHNQYEVALSGRIAMSVMLAFTTLGHFIYTKGMTMMIPDFIPFKKEIVYFTGIFETAAAIGLHISQIGQLTGWALIIFFLVMLPANINAAIKHIDYQKGTLDGSGINYLWFRVPLQVVFILWTYCFSIKY
jgi:uncharacterized membrane protein